MRRSRRRNNESHPVKKGTPHKKSFRLHDNESSSGDDSRSGDPPSPKRIRHNGKPYNFADVSKPPAFHSSPYRNDQKESKIPVTNRFGRNRPRIVQSQDLGISKLRKLFGMPAPAGSDREDPGPSQTCDTSTSSTNKPSTSAIPNFLPLTTHTAGSHSSLVRATDTQCLLTTSSVQEATSRDAFQQWITLYPTIPLGSCYRRTKESDGTLLVGFMQQKREDGRSLEDKAAELNEHLVRLCAAGGLTKEYTERLGMSPTGNMVLFNGSELPNEPTQPCNLPQPAMASTPGQGNKGKSSAT